MVLQCCFKEHKGIGLPFTTPDIYIFLRINFPIVLSFMSDGALTAYSSLMSFEIGVA